MKYNLALQKAINCKKTNGEPTRVLDIGTGTGLLAMMAAKSGSSLITACEVSTLSSKHSHFFLLCTYLGFDQILDISTHGHLCKKSDNSQWL